MPDRTPTPDDAAVSRRTFLEASGTLAAAGLLGAGAAAPAAAFDDPVDERFLNWRIAEAEKVWDRGYRGRPDRTLGLTDSGIEARHPDLGPWNGARIRPDGTDIDLEHVEMVERPVPVTEPETFEEHAFAGTNVGAEGIGVGDTETEPFDLPAQDGDDVSGHRIDATLTWNVESPEAQPTALQWTLQRETDGGWTDVEVRGSTFTESVMSDNVVEMALEVPADDTYRFRVDPARGPIDWEIAVELQALVETGGHEPGLVREVSPLDRVDLPDQARTGEVTPETPKTVAWYGEITDYGGFDIPRDSNGHGTHCSGIMTGTGRASTIDDDRTEVHELGGAVVGPTDAVEYEVSARAGTGIFASAFGENVVVEICYGDDVIGFASVSGNATVADAPTVHEEGEATYIVRVRAAETESFAPAAEDLQRGTSLVGTLDRVAVGAFKHADETVGQRVDGGETSMHAGVAPNASLAGFHGLGGPTEDLGEIADAVASELDLRAVNMSWGPIFGVPVNAFGLLPANADAIRNMADAGILTVAAAGNAWTPANGNGEPAAVGEAISVVATDPFDGITGYSAGGIGTVNEEMDGVDLKPDVTAPGGDLKPDAFGTIVLGNADALTPVGISGDSTTPTPDTVELVRATANADPDERFDEHPPRGHTSKGGTSMASPYVCGVAGLVAQAMEEDAPEAIRLPEPGETTYDDVMRLKQVILATASTTAFTAAPHHNAQLMPSPATYTHGDRDPYEGYGRVNPDAAVDAVTRDLLGDDDAATYAETVGLDVPFDSRAVAGYVDGSGGASLVPGNDLEVSVTFDRYTGADRGLARADPHIDLFVYDAGSPDAVGEPHVVASDVGVDGQASLTVDTVEEKVYYVLAKLVNVPGAFNGHDVQTHFDLDVSQSG